MFYSTVDYSTMLRDCSVFSMVPMYVFLQIHPILIKYDIKCLMNQLYVYSYIEISVISNVLTLTNRWKACRKRLNWHTYFQDKSLSRFQPSSESPRRFFYSVVFYGKDGTITKRCFDVVCVLCSTTPL